MDNLIPDNYNNDSENYYLTQNPENNIYSWMKEEHITITVPLIMNILQFDKNSYKKKLLKKYVSKNDFYKILLRGDRRLARAYKTKKINEVVQLDNYVYFLSISATAIFIFLMALLYFAPRHENGFIFQILAIVMIVLGILTLFLLEYMNIKKPIKEGKSLEDYYYYPLKTYCQEINMEINNNLYFEFSYIEKALKIHVKSSKKDIERYNENENLFEDDDSKSSSHSSEDESDNEENENDNELISSERESFMEEEKKGNKGDKRNFGKIRSKTITQKKNSKELSDKILKNISQSKYNIDNGLNPIIEKPEAEIDAEMDGEIEKEKESSATLSLPFLSSIGNDFDKDIENNFDSEK